ncbi:MAG: serine/threonine-protein kinase [Chloroflexota bacterium]|nr:serine/threonine-protein kinase [Chloroflexota bacterium]
MATSLIGQTLGKTQIVGLLGRGGMATVYKGYQADIDRHVAVKVLPPQPEQDKAFIERFKLEARTIARLQHPHILPLYDYGDENGVLYLVTAFATGGSLDDIIKKERLSLTQIERILRQVTTALDYAHRQGIIHRDIKPGNILLDNEGNALLADFGIVKLLTGANTTSGNLTNASSVVGTPAYMAPEQANGLPVDGRTDIYALGVVTYEMLTGRQPFSAETPLQLLIKHLTEPPPHLSAMIADTPPALDLVLQRALAKSADDRYQTAAGFADAFAQAISNADTGTLKLPQQRTTGSTPASTAASSAPQTAAVSGVVQPPVTGSTKVFPTDGGGTITVVAPRTPAWLMTLLVVFLGLVALAVVFLALVTVNNNNRETTQPTSVVIATATAAAPPTAVVAVLPTADANQFGSANFANNDALGDTVNIRVENLAPLPEGEHYAVWLLNEAEERLLLLGIVNIDTFGEGQLTYTDPEGALLPALYNQVIVTRETEQVEAPSDTIVYAGSVPAAVTTALSQIAWESPDGINGDSLLRGALTEARIARQHTGYAANANNLAGLQQHAEHSINIYLGTRDDLDNSGRGENPGRGIGLTFFLERIEAQLNAANVAAAGNAEVELQLEYMRVCVANVRGWMNETIALERGWIGATDFEATAAEREQSTTIASQVMEGFDLNGNGVVELFEGECGLEQIGESVILLGNMTLRGVEGG